jgi:hypothetical protein
MTRHVFRTSRDGCLLSGPNAFVDPDNFGSNPRFSLSERLSIGFVHILIATTTSWYYRRPRRIRITATPISIGKTLLKMLDAKDSRTTSIISEAELSAFPEPIKNHAEKDPFAVNEDQSDQVNFRTLGWMRGEYRPIARNRA